MIWEEWFVLSNFPKDRYAESIPSIVVYCIDECLDKGNDYLIRFHLGNGRIVNYRCCNYKGDLLYPAPTFRKDYDGEVEFINIEMSGTFWVLRVDDIVGVEVSEI